MKAPRHPGGTLRLATRPQNQALPARPHPVPPQAAPATVQREAGAKAMRHPGGTLRLPGRPRDEAPSVPPAPSPPEVAPAVASPAQPDPAGAAAYPEADQGCEPGTREDAAARRRRQTREVLALLRARWPEAFAAPVPLAIGIVQEIRKGLGETHVPAVQLSRAMQFWTRGPGYLATVAAGQRRRHLDGTDAGEPDEAHRQHARDILAERAVRRGQASDGLPASPPGA